MDKKDKLIAKAKFNPTTKLDLILDDTGMRGRISHQEAMDFVTCILENIGNRCKVCEVEGITMQPMWNATVITDKELEELLEENDYQHK